MSDNGATQKVTGKLSRQRDNQGEIITGGTREMGASAKYERHWVGGQHRQIPDAREG
jgi:hypothetical protein